LLLSLQRVENGDSAGESGNERLRDLELLLGPRDIGRGLRGGVGAALDRSAVGLLELLASARL
jgi:hypothetical protein